LLIFIIDIMENLKNAFENIELQKLEKEKNKDYIKLYFAVKDFLENNIFEDCYIFEYIEQYNKKEYVNPENMYINENKQWVNDLKYKKHKEIVKIKEPEKYKIKHILEWANEGHDDVHFWFNTSDNMKNPNKHLYKILDIHILDEYEISYFHNTDGEHETMVRLRNIIPISLKPFKM